MKEEVQKITWQIRAMQTTLYLMAGLIPLYVSTSHLFSFTTSKALLMILGAVILAIFYFLEKISEKETTLQLSLVHGFLLFYLLLISLSAWHGINPTLSFFGNLTNGVGVNLIISLSVLAAVLGFLIKKDPKFLIRLLCVSLITSIIVAVGTYFIHTFPTTDEGSTLGNSSYAGAYLFLNICFAIIIFISQKKIWQKILTGVGTAIIVFSPIFFNVAIWKGQVTLGSIFHNPLLLMGSANGAGVGLVVALVFIISLFLTRSNKKTTQNISVGIFIIFLISFFVVGSMLLNPNTNLHQKYVEQKTNNRFLFWDIAREGLIEHPALGVGMNNYSYLFQSHFTPEFLGEGYHYEPWTDNPHNMFWEYAANGGILGLISYLILIAGTIIVLYKISGKEDNPDQRIIAIILAGGLAGYFVQSLFIFDTPVPLFFMFIIIGATIGLSETKNIIWPSKYNGIKIAISSIGIVAVLVASFFIFFKPWEETKAWIGYTNPTTIINAKNTPQQISGMGDAADSAYVAGKIIDQINSQLPKMTPEERNSQIKVVASLLNNLEEELKTGNDNFRGEWVAGQILDLLIFLQGKADLELIKKAQDHFQKAYQINPNNPLLYLDMSQSYIFENKFNVAYGWVRASIALAPQNLYAYKIAGRILQAAPNKSFENYAKTMMARWIKR
ncbi:MAG: O-antigen ligase family protein [Patescibacteria group bacterium]